MSAQAVKSTQYFYESTNSLAVDFEAERNIYWCRMQPSPRPCFTRELLDEIVGLRTFLAGHGVNDSRDQHRPAHVVFTSATTGVFNLGGDLQLFLELIEAKDRKALESYAIACIDALYRVSVGFDLPVTTVSVVQGQALGGGMEGALATNYLIAERQVTMGLPEVLFNLFPGMGAFSFLSRRLGPARAEEMIMSGRTWNAEELHEMGVVDMVAEPGEGITAARAMIDRRLKCANTTAAMRQVRQRVNQVSYEELLDVTMIWVDAALKLSDKDLRVMQRLVRAQNRLVNPAPFTPRAVA